MPVFPLLILIGSMNLTRTLETGEYHCPNCGETKTYRRRSRRPFLTLYFIPVFPIGNAEEFIQCNGCRENWDLSVLEAATETAMEISDETFREEALRASILAVIADQSISEDEIGVLQRVSSRLLQRPIDREELGQLCSAAYENRITAINYITTRIKHWNPEQRALGLQAVFLVASVDGSLSSAQLSIMKKMQELLEVSDQEFHQLVEASLRWEAV